SDNSVNYNCYVGDFLMVRRFDPLIDIETSAPNCEMPLGFRSLDASSSLQQCLKQSCLVNGANVIFYNAAQTRCEIYRCNSNSDGSDWDYNWEVRHTVMNDSTGVTYARPRPKLFKCYNSYFVRRTWRTGVGLKSNCYRIDMVNVQNLKECMEKSCDHKANVFNFVDATEHMPTTCEMTHCKWSLPENDYDLNLVENNIYSSTVFSLGHTTKPFYNLSMEQSVALSIKSHHTPPKCNDAESSFKTKSEVIPNSLHEAGFNSIQFLARENKFIAFKCRSNSEGTKWKYYENNFCDSEMNEFKWWNAPYPGTPNCENEIFTQISAGPQCKISACRDSFRVNEARDLRQCMIYACERGYNVINYYNSKQLDDVICELRRCPKSENGNYIYNFEYAKAYADYSIYALISDPTLAPNPKPHPISTATPTDVPLVETIGIAAPLGLVFCIILVCIIVKIYCRYRHRRKKEYTTVNSDDD
ncbi:unnamed protein product, partial [Owenia fusiformis]